MNPAADDPAPASGPDRAVELDRAVEQLVRQVGHWQSPRWSALAADGNVSRADLVHRLVQEVANLAADAEGQPRRTVPRLENDLALPDQLRVVAADLVAAAPASEALARAAAEVTATRSAL
ncbi:hypothetical protein Misp04_17410 [Micromonospora sp. NBRC 101691]|nr:hypothetical protein Misp04_17410 [Micromonospora sp. NBRC 101691]